MHRYPVLRGGGRRLRAAQRLAPRGSRLTPLRAPGGAEARRCLRTARRSQAPAAPRRSAGGAAPRAAAPRPLATMSRVEQSKIVGRVREHEDKGRRRDDRSRQLDQLWLQRPKPTLRGPRNHARPRVHGSFKASGRAGISGNERLLPASTTCTGFTGLGSGDRFGGRRGGSGTFEGRLAGGRTARAWVETRARNWRFVAESLPAFHHFVVSARESAGCPPVRSA